MKTSILNRYDQEVKITGQKLIVYNAMQRRHSARVGTRDGRVEIYPGWWTRVEVGVVVNDPIITISDPDRRLRELEKDGILEKMVVPDTWPSRTLYRIWRAK